jgi:hypothetical protein
MFQMVKPEQSAGTPRNGAAEPQRPRERRSPGAPAFQTVAARASAWWWASAAAGGWLAVACPTVAGAPCRCGRSAMRHGSFPAAPINTGEPRARNF